MLPRLPPHLRVDRELSAGRTWLVRDVHSADSLIVKKCSGAAPSLMRRWRQVARRADGHIVIERDLFVREDGVIALRPYVNGQPLPQLRNAPFERATEMLLASRSISRDSTGAG